MRPVTSSAAVPSHTPPAPDDINGLDDLVERMAAAETTRDWSFILKDHLTFGNKKLKDTIAIFNIGSATDCINLGTEHCQVPPEACYAHRDENLYPNALAYRRRQEYLWDCLDPDSFADAFLELVERKRKPVRFLRFNESGDFRHQSDVLRVDRVADRLAEHGIQTYTYTASDFLDYADATHVVINASNPWVEGVDQRFNVVAETDAVPDDGFVCPSSTGGPTCGECLACMAPGGDDTIYEYLRE